MTETAVEKYAGLSNEEILLVYFRFKNYLDNLEENFKDRKVSKQIDTPLGKATAIVEVPQSHIDKFRATDYYKHTVAVVNKLQPIAELLMECDDHFKKLADELR